MHDDGTGDDLRFRARCLNRGLFNTSTLRHRGFDGFIVSMNHAGTHWLKYMVGLVLADLYDVPAPKPFQDDTVVGHTKSPPLYPGIPQIVHAHSVANYLLAWGPLFRLLHYPKYLILIRDIRDLLVAHYEKWKDDYGVDFSTYVRGDVRGRAYHSDIWGYIRFLNAWGAVVESHPDQARILKYEDLRADTRGCLAETCAYFGLAGATPELLERVIKQASKDEMAKHPNPGERQVIRTDPRPSADWYGEADRRFVAAVCRRHLRHAFGYDYG